MTTPETTEKIHDIVLADCRLKAPKSGKPMGIAQGSENSILQNHLCVRELSVRKVPRLSNYVANSKECLAFLIRNLDKFLHFMTVDEPWIYTQTHKWLRSSRNSKFFRVIRFVYQPTKSLPQK